ncbi:ABC transporter substrate-binding protein [cf. Phormidesmis sp. LEGE 11477]|uniref:ABC transporter substrate-binding protein n=1 Tax=cf. Phormidesmis sp. LEGE 11477 TaxID=1828680 RepID=UPI0018821DDB|nr:ABC transporter substrate-binding protein [cf. Phormidesmis sp. LEGE 11477]MBE9063865.1 carbohydrate ABC transporter substrate-binding protein [cf. Phormidesmis sp. LEGE 11477]
MKPFLKPTRQRNNSSYRLLGLALGSLFLLSSCDGASTESAENTVTVLGVVVGEQQEKLEQALAPFEEETGIDVVYEGTDAFATLLPVRVESGDAPDLAMFPQPGLLADFARAGQLIPLNTFIDTSTLRAAYPDTWIELGSVDDEAYGIWYRASVKSLVWYRPTAFEEAGYEIPSTWAELIDLSDQIVADGATPWCIGLESGDASGWPGTDWVEDIMLRTAGPEAYSQWVDHDLPFDSAEVVNAFNEFGEILLDPEYVNGGAVGAVSTPFGDSAQGIFNEPPSCYLHRQANFIATFFPEEAEPRVDYDVFPLPEIDPRFGTPILVAGDAFGMFNDTPEARALMQYLATPQPHEIWAGLGGFISPHKQVSTDAYPDITSQKIAQILADAEVISFDGSDMMPGAVGTGTFWSGIIDFAVGESAEEVTGSIESSWPE